VLVLVSVGLAVTSLARPGGSSDASVSCLSQVRIRIALGFDADAYKTSQQDTRLNIAVSRSESGSRRRKRLARGSVDRH
jgi:hypothetical protein